VSAGTAARTGLLSRIAETLLWTGRYIERADDTARMVDVYVHRMLEEPQAGEEAACSALLAVLGMPPPEDARLDIGMTLDQLAYDEKSPSAIAGAVLAARLGARSVREVISSEMWECLNVTGLGLPGQRRAAERLGPHVYLRFIRERAALFFGRRPARGRCRDRLLGQRPGRLRAGRARPRSRRAPRKHGTRARAYARRWRPRAGVNDGGLVPS
jgi:hypothetical protein